MNYAIYAGALLAYATLAVVAVLWLIGRARTLLHWYRKTRFGQAAKPIRGVLDLPRLLKVMEFRNEQDHQPYRYKPLFACIGTAKFAVGVMYLEGKKKPGVTKAADLKPRTR